MAHTKTVAVEVDDRNIQRPWDESDLVTDWSAFPEGYGILLNERLIFPEDLCLWRMKIDTTRQLFVDDYLIAHMRNLKRQFHSPRDHPANPVLTHLRGDGLSSAYGAYFCPDEEHGYRMYYGGPGGHNYVAYSSDGINWDKPDLGIYDHSAEPHRFIGGPNNTVAGGANFGLLEEANDPDPSKRWKTVTVRAGSNVTWPYQSAPPSNLVLPVPGLGEVIWMTPGHTHDDSLPAGGSRVHILTSPDGLRWTGETETALVKGPALFQAPNYRPVGISDMLRVRWDPKLNKYIANIKYFIGPDLRVTPVCHVGRVVAMCESDDLIHWSSPRIYAYPDGEDIKMPGMWGIYEADGFPYESMWLNPFSMTWYHPVSREEHRKRNLMPTRPYIKRNRIRLAGSRDGRHWYYLGDRRTFIELGPEDSWKPHYLRMANLCTVGGPLVKDDELWFYYIGANTDGPKGGWHKSTGLAILRRDGFASLNATDESGLVITRPMVFEGEGKLFVNAEVSGNGHVRASIMAEDGSPIDGFSENDCRAVSGDSTRSRVAWGTNETLAALKGRYLRLAFHLKHARLYSFWIE